MIEFLEIMNSNYNLHIIVIDWIRAGAEQLIKINIKSVKF